MAWERFGYICRKVSSTLQEGETVSECITRVEKEPGCNLYGDAIRAGSLPRKILNDIGHLYSNDEAKDVIKIYSELDLSERLEEPMQFKRVTVYLALVVVVFFFVSEIYQLKVAPTFLETFETFDVSIPHHLMFFRDYWNFFMVSVFSMLGLALCVGYILRGLFQFKRGCEKGFVYRYLTFKGIRYAYENIIHTLTFPISNKSSEKGGSTSAINEHLLSIKCSGMNVGTEMKEIIRTDMNTLVDLCEKQMRYISVLIAVVVVAVIFFFLFSAYSPLFMLGETI